MAMVKGFQKTSVNLPDMFSGNGKKILSIWKCEKKIDNDMKKCLPYKSLQMPCSSTEFCQSYNIVKDSNVDLTVGNWNSKKDP